MQTYLDDNPNGSLAVIDIRQARRGARLRLPLFTASIQAGFPSPADDYIDQQLDLNELIIQRPSATFFVRVQGDSMQNAGIFSGDILVVDRSLTPVNGTIIVAVLDGEFTVKRLMIEDTGVYLVPENPAYPRLRINSDAQFQVWGIVTYVIHKAR
jgi:DNA polymerase V